MRNSIFCDRRELRRLEYTIASIEARHGSTLRDDCLLEALKAERTELLRVSGRRAARSGTRRAA